VTHRVIAIEAAAAPKPPYGSPCNGCGACCLAEPCPLGILVSRRRQGRCAALNWDDGSGRYRCGLLATWSDSRWPSLARFARYIVQRWIAAGHGCDSTAIVEPQV
jgi:hypothetical protein